MYFSPAQASNSYSDTDQGEKGGGFTLSVLHLLQLCFAFSSKAGLCALVDHWAGGRCPIETSLVCFS